MSLHHFDSIGVPSTEETERTFRGGEGWQAAASNQWIEQLAASPDDVDV